MRVLPFCLLLFIIFLPWRHPKRAKKPCFRFRFTMEGCHVLFKNQTDRSIRSSTEFLSRENLLERLSYITGDATLAEGSGTAAGYAAVDMRLNREIPDLIDSLQKPSIALERRFKVQSTKYAFRSIKCFDSALLQPLALRPTPYTTHTPTPHKMMTKPSTQYQYEIPLYPECWITIPLLYSTAVNTFVYRGCSTISMISAK